MKKHRLLAIWYLLLATFLVCPHSGIAQVTEYWDALGQKSGTGGGGTGSWTSSAVDWYVSGPADTTWTAGNLAQFSGTAGTVTVTGPLSAGTLTFTTAGYTVAGSGQILTLTGTPTINFPAGTTTINCVLAGSGGVTYGGSGTLILGGVNTYTGGSIFTNGTVQCAATGIGTANGSITFSNGATLHNTGTALTSSGPVTLGTGGGHIFAATLTGPVTGGGGLTFHSGDSVLNSSAVCNYGTITMAAANRLFISTSNSIAGAKLVASASGAYIIFQNLANSFPTNQMSFVSGSILTARATLLGGGPLNVDTTNVTFPTTGTMIFNQDSTSSGAATTGIVVTGDYPTLTGNLTIQLGAGTSANATGPLTLNGAISDGGFGYALNKTSPNGASLGTLILNGTNSYYGNTTVTAGGLIIGGSGALGVTASSTNYAGNIILTAASSSLTNATTATQLWSGQISGAGKLTQSGPGMLTLDNSETYTGETAINGGTLALGPSGSITSSKISIAAGATFDVSQPNGGSYTFSGTTFSARGASSPAILNGASGGSINFGSATIALVYDATNRPLTIAWSAGTAGTLTLNNNPFTVSNTGPALVQGSYPLFQLPAGTTIVPSSGIFPASVTGNGLANGTDEGVVVVNAGTVVLVVQTSHHNSEVWNGADFNNSPNWSDGANWVSGVPPTNGDILTFSGATGLSPVMDNSYNITSLTFDTNATNSFALNNNGSGTLSISGGVSNNSTFAQTLGMPVALVGVVSAWSIPNSNASITLNGPLSDSGNGFTLTGQGPLTLAGNNTFTGGMTDGTNSTLQVTGDLGDTGGGSGSYAGAITDNGTLIFANSSQQTLSGPIADNGVLIFNSFASDTVSGQISGTGSLTQMGGNTVTLGNAANNYAGGTTITGGTVSISADSALGTGPLTFDNGGRLVMTGSTITDNRLITVQSGGGVMSQSGPTVTLNGPLTGPGTLSVSGNDFILAPTGTNTLGSLHETGGNRVFVSTAGALGAGTNLTSINMAGITGSVLDFQNSAPTNPQNAMVFGSGSSLTARNNGGYPGLTVSTTNVTFPTSGTMVFNRDSGAAGTATQPIVINGDYPMLTGPLTIALGGGTGTAVTGPVTLNGAINDGGSGFGLTVSSANVNSLGSLTLNGTNGYTGDTILNFGSLTIGTNGDLGDTGPGNGGLYAGAITINGSLNNAASVNQTWSGQIAGPGSLTQNGTGTLYLDGANTYSGATVVNGGLLGGTGTIAGDVTVNGGGLAPGHSIGTLTINGNLAFNAGSMNVFEVNGSTPANDLVIAGASVTYGGVLKIVPTGAFTIGQQFVLFSGAGATNASNFASIQSTGLNFGFTNGVLTLLSTSATNPTNIQFHVSGNTMTLSWPSDHLGWTLYSNSISLRATNQWFPLAGTSSVTSTNLTINHGQANVFFRLQAH